MTFLEYRDEVFELSITADRLAAVASLLNAYYFERRFDGDDPIARNWWVTHHDRIQDVTGMIAEIATDVKRALAELNNAKLETGEEAQA